MIWTFFITFPCLKVRGLTPETPKTPKQVDDKVSKSAEIIPEKLVFALFEIEWTSTDAAGLLQVKSTNSGLKIFSGPKLYYFRGL